LFSLVFRSLLRLLQLTKAHLHIKGSLAASVCLQSAGEDDALTTTLLRGFAGNTKPPRPSPVLVLGKPCADTLHGIIYHYVLLDCPVLRFTLSSRSQKRRSRSCCPTFAVQMRMIPPSIAVSVFCPLFPASVLSVIVVSVPADVHCFLIS